MIDIGELQGHVVINGADEAIRGIKGVVEELGRGGRSLSDFENGLKVVGDSLDRLGKDLTTKVSLPLGALGAASYKLASDFEETLSKTDAVFKDTADVIRDWASTSINDMGMAQATALDMASGFGAMGSSIGLAKEQTDTYAMSLTQLASDLSSFHNMSLDQVKTALNGVFTGETESIKQLGIAMTVTNLEAFALTQGIEKQWKEMSQAEQVQLRYNYVMHATKDAQGDFARTSSSSANQLKILVESLKELGTTIGAEIIPIITPMVTHLIELVQGFGELDEETKENIVQFGLIAVAAGPLTTGLGKVVGAVGGLLSGLKSLNLFLSTNPYAIAVTALTALVAGATYLVVDFLTWSDKVEAKAEETGRKIEQIKKGIYDTSGAEKEMEVLDVSIMKYERLTAKIKDNEREIKRLEGTHETLKTQVANGTLTQTEYYDKVNDTSEAIKMLQTENSNYKYSLSEVDNELVKGYGSAEKAIEYKNALSDAVNKAVVPSLKLEQQQLIHTSNVYAETGKATVFNSSQQAQAEIDNTYATIKALQLKQKALYETARANGGYEEEMRNAERAYSEIGKQINALEEYRGYVTTTYDALIVEEQRLSDEKDKENNKQTKSKAEKVKTEEELEREALERLKDLRTEEVKAIEEAYAEEKQQSVEHYNTERDSMEEAYSEHMRVLEAYCQERYTALESEYEGEKGLLTGLYDELNEFDEKEKERKRQEKEQSFKDKIDTLENELYKAKSVEERQRIEKQLLDEEKRYKDYLADEKRKADRQDIVDRIEATKAEYAEKKKVIEEENKQLVNDAKAAHEQSLADLEANHKEELDSIAGRLDKEKELVIAYSEEELSIKKKARDDVKSVQEETTRNNRDELAKQLEDMKSLRDEMRQAGIDNAQAYRQGLESVQGSLNYAGCINGSHENGLGYVPFDGYIAELHQGERVLTKSEAQVYNSTVNNNMDTSSIERLLSDVKQEIASVKETVKRMPQEQQRLNRQGGK